MRLWHGYGFEGAEDPAWWPPHVRAIFAAIGRATGGKRLYPETLKAIPQEFGGILSDHQVTIKHIGGKELGQRKGAYTIEVTGPAYAGRWKFRSGELEQLSKAAAANGAGAAWRSTLRNRRMKYPWDAIVWWELRRIPYNVALAVLGSITVVVVLWIGSHLTTPGEDIMEPPGLFVGVILYGIAANIFYTLGWISELLWGGGDTSRTEPFRRRVFIIGLVASSVITLFPSVLISALWLALGFQHGQ
jgi:hypothetical protein